MKMSNQIMARDLASRYSQTMAKAMLSTSAGSSAGAAQLDFAELLTQVNTYYVPLTMRMAMRPAKGVTHEWREITVPARTNMKAIEGSAAAAGTSVTPDAYSNTCEILKATISISNSAKAEAANGLYGSELTMLTARELDLLYTQLLEAREYDLLFGVEVTKASAGTSSARAMKGLVGAPGAWNGWLQTNQYPVSGDFSKAGLDALLTQIWKSQPKKLPNAIVCSIEAQAMMSNWASLYRAVVTPDQLGNMVASHRVTAYQAPWNGILEVIAHPLCANSVTAANNWAAVITLEHDYLAFADLRPLMTHPIVATAAGAIDADIYEIITETTCEVRGEYGQGLLTGFDEVSAADMEGS